MSLTSSSSLSPPYGAHPTIVTDVQAPGDTESSACSLYLHYSLPPILFVDPYELDMRQQQYTVVGLKGKGARELEKPVHALPDEDGIEVILKTDSVVEQVQLPIHVRYGKPTFNTSYVVQPLDAPTVVLACSSSEASFPACSRSSHLIPKFLLDSLPSLPSSSCLVSTPNQPPLEVSIPLGNTADLPTVELGTALVILACFVWVAWEGWRVSFRLGGREKAKTL